MSDSWFTDLGAEEDYAEEFQDPPLSPCTGEWEANWDEFNHPPIAAEVKNRETVTTDTVLSMYSSDQ